MSNQNQSIHDFDVNLIVDYYSTLERQGPGSPEITLKALSFVEGLSSQSHLADIGCGTGGQTMVLGANTEGKITGIDLFPKFVELFTANAAKHQLTERLKCQQASMDELPFQKNELDLIWSEGAIYNIGFEKGLRYWRQFLKSGGYVAVSEATWFTEKRPDEIHDFWMDAYPGIDTLPNKVAQMQAAGYRPIATFVLPDSCWIHDFYAPQKEAQELFLKNQAGNAFAEGFIANQRHEEQLYRKYKDYYGYAFYIGKKV